MPKTHRQAWVQIPSPAYSNMEIIKNKSYEEKEQKEFGFISYNNKGTLSIVMKDGTHYNFNGDELNKIIKFIKKIEI